MSKITFKKRKKYKYLLMQEYSDKINIKPEMDIDTYFYALSTSGELLIKKKYAWDGASGPAIDTKNIMRGSLVHDVLYQMLREEQLEAHFRKNADQIFKNICLEDGMWRFFAWLVYVGVRLFGASSAKPDIQQAP